MTLQEQAGHIFKWPGFCRGRLLGKVASIHSVGQQLWIPLPALALTPLQSILSPAARVILVRHQWIVRVLSPKPYPICPPIPSSLRYFPSLTLLPPGTFLPSLKHTRNAPAWGLSPCYFLFLGFPFPKFIFFFTRNVNSFIFVNVLKNFYFIWSLEFEKRIDTCICITESYCLLSHILKVFTHWGHPWPFYS